jgi:hypothetical protein
MLLKALLQQVEVCVVGMARKDSGTAFTQTIVSRVVFIADCRPTFPVSKCLIAIICVRTATVFIIYAATLHLTLKAGSWIN